MNSLYYDMIFKRKSFHIFKDTLSISHNELEDIKHKIYTFKPLIEDIKYDIRIVPANKTTCKRGQEYCILFYSEKKDNYLQNIGYIGEQLDLYLASLDIGSLWFGIGKTEEKTYNGLYFVIMIAISKMPTDKFRKDMFKSKRKPIEEIWSGNQLGDIANIVRFTPSACNTQPWKVIVDNSKVSIYRYKKPGKRGIMPADKVAYYNRIDIGIFLLFLEVCFLKKNYKFNRKLYMDISDDISEMVLESEYQILWIKKNVPWSNTKDI